LKKLATGEKRETPEKGRGVTGFFRENVGTRKKSELLPRKNGPTRETLNTQPEWKKTIKRRKPNENGYIGGGGGMKNAIPQERGQGPWKTFSKKPRKKGGKGTPPKLTGRTARIRHTKNSRRKIERGEGKIQEWEITSPVGNLTWPPLKKKRDKKEKSPDTAPRKKHAWPKEGGRGV